MPDKVPDAMCRRLHVITASHSARTQRLNRYGTQASMKKVVPAYLAAGGLSQIEMCLTRVRGLSAKLMDDYSQKTAAQK